MANNGNLTAINAVVKDVLPAGFIFSDDGASTKAWDLGDIKSGEIKNIDYLVDITNEAAAGTHTNTAEIKADNHDPVTAEARIDIRDTAVAGIKLAGSGFKLLEFITLLLSLWFLLSLASIIKRKYLKLTIKKLSLLKKTLIFNPDLYIYQRADNYYKNR